MRKRQKLFALGKLSTLHVGKMATEDGNMSRHISRNNPLSLVESGTSDNPSRKRKSSCGCFDWIYFLKRKKDRDSSTDTDIVTKQGEKPEDCTSETCISTPDTDKENKYNEKPDTLKQPTCEENTDDWELKVTQEYLQKIKKYIKKQENWNRRLRNKLMELTKEPVGTEVPKPPTMLDVQSIIGYKRSLEKDNRVMTKQIKKLTNTCISTPDMDTENKYNEKPDTLKQPTCEENTDDWELKVTKEYLQKIKKYIKKQENWNRRLRNKLMELTKEPVGTEVPKPPTTLDVQSIIGYKRSLEKDNRVMSKQIKKLTNGCFSMPSTGKQAEPAEEPENCPLQL